jgi:hypothetical protein
VTRFMPASDLATEVVDDAVYAARLPSGPIVVLEGVSAVIWEEACADGDRVVEHVAARTGRAPEEIAESVTAFVDRLVADGLLVRGP